MTMNKTLRVDGGVVRDLAQRFRVFAAFPENVSSSLHTQT